MRTRSWLLFGPFSLASVVFLFAFLYRNSDWNPYTVWILAFSLATFFVYAADKALAIVQGPRAPEVLLNLLALLGGFSGAWLGILLLRHKINLSKHLDIWLVLLLSTLGHAALVYFWFMRGR